MKQRSLDILKETAFSMRKPDVEVKCIALGMGVQSTAMYLMSSMGLMERADYAVFADPMSEHPETYKLLDWIIEWQEDNNGIPIYTCSNDLYSDILKGVSIRGGSFTTLPVFGKNKILQRQCTADYKIDVVKKRLREVLGIPVNKWMPLTEMWLGITIDEATRMKEPYKKKKYRLYNRYPFIEMLLSRDDCINFLRDNKFPMPVKSACVFCPFQSNDKWKDLKDNHPDEWKRVVNIDNAVRHNTINKGMDEEFFLHPSRTPIDEIDFDGGQLDMFDNECEGYCGL